MRQLQKRTHEAARRSKTRFEKKSHDVEILSHIIKIKSRAQSLSGMQRKTRLCCLANWRVREFFPGAPYYGYKGLRNAVAVMHVVLIL